MVVVPCLFRVWVEILLLPAFFCENLVATYSANSVLRWTEFHQNRKDPTREIQWLADLGHNLDFSCLATETIKRHPVKKLKSENV